MWTKKSVKKDTLTSIWVCNFLLFWPVEEWFTLFAVDSHGVVETVLALSAPLSLTADVEGKFFQLHLLIVNTFVRMTVAIAFWVKMDYVTKVYVKNRGSDWKNSGCFLIFLNRSLYPLEETKRKNVHIVWIPTLSWTQKCIWFNDLATWTKIK